jgi:hypothetical protein
MTMVKAHALFERRDFLKAAAAGTAGAMLAPACTASRSEAAGPRTVTVLGLIDIAQALADASLDNNVYWFDNNAAIGSTHLGTDHLETTLHNGDLIQWLISGLEVETAADIAGIIGPATAIAHPVELELMPGMVFWAGQIVGQPKGLFPYSITLKVENKLMTMNSTLALNVL